MTITLDTELPVVDKVRLLVDEALSGDSIYIRVKETIQNIFEDGLISAPDKAKVLTEVLGALNQVVVNSAMNTGLQWAVQEKSLALQKLELEYKLDLLESQAEQAAEAVLTETAKRQQLQAQTLRVYGTNVKDSEGNVISLNADGQIYEEVQLVKEKVDTEVLTQSNITAKTQETYASTNALVAKTYNNDGVYNGYTISATGLTNVNEAHTHLTLNDYQKAIAEMQAKGYAYNAWANAAQSSSSMIGVLLSSENESALTTADVGLWRTAVDKLNTIPLPTIS